MRNFYRTAYVLNVVIVSIASSQFAALVVGAILGPHIVVIVNYVEDVRYTGLAVRVQPFETLMGSLPQQEKVLYALFVAILQDAVAIALLAHLVENVGIEKIFPSVV